MASTLPIIDPCCTTQCTTDSGSVVQIAGPQGPPGADGAAGAPGVSGKNSYTTLTAAFTMPAELGVAQAQVVNTGWVVQGQIIVIYSIGYMRVISIDSSTLMTLQNLENTATQAYLINAPPGTIAGIGSRVSPGGEQGPSGGGGQIYIDYHLTSTPPTDPSKPALSYPSASGTLFQWVVATQTWV